VGAMLSLSAMVTVSLAPVPPDAVAGVSVPIVYVLDVASVRTTVELPSPDVTTLVVMGGPTSALELAVNCGTGWLPRFPTKVILHGPPALPLTDTLFVPIVDSTCRALCTVAAVAL
jgi:hypothetical protein